MFLILIVNVLIFSNLCLIVSSGTINPQPNFNARGDAETLKKALKRIGTDDKTVTRIIAGRTNFERQKIAQEYQNVAKRNLLAHIKSDTSGKYEDILVALMTPAAEFDAQLANKALKGFGMGYGLDLNLLVEILLTRTPRQIQGMKAAYQQLYKKDLTQDITKAVSPDVRDLLVQLSKGTRDDSNTVDRIQAKNDAEALFKVGGRNVGTNLPVLNEIVSQRNYDQLRQIFEEYKQVSQRPIEDTIKKEISGKPQKTLLTIMQCIKDPAGYFAERLRHSLKGMGTSEDELIRVLTTRSEVDLDKIRSVYHQKYGKDLEKAIRGDVHGKFQDVLVALVRGNKT